MCSDRTISFGSIHPDTDDYKRDIGFVASLGLKGLKFHAEYQDFVIDAPRMLKIYDYALGKNLIVLHHAGCDPGFPLPYRSSPRQFVNIANAMRGGVIVAAHLGGHRQWDDVEHILAGSDIFLDTSMGFDCFSTEQVLRIVRKHGDEKVLFASDSPWGSPKTELEALAALPLPEQTFEAITWKNAERILQNAG
jgi:predicted TIM-barrel fold metal-dependent hydrolase